MVNQNARILAVDDEPVIRQVITEALARNGYQCVSASGTEEALRHLHNNPVTLVLSDIRMPGSEGIDLLKEVVSTFPDVGVVMVSAVTDVSRAVEAMKLGAYDYITKPFSIEEMVFRVQRALERHQLIIENRAYKEELERLVAERTAALEGRVRELNALNAQFREHLAEGFETEEQYNVLARSIEEASDQLKTVVALVEARRASRVNGGAS